MTASIRTLTPTTGPPRLAVVLLHGRGSSADDILSLADVLEQPSALYLAPQAETGSWYPYSFLAPIAHNEPHLSAALRAVGEAILAAGASGIPAERTVIMGFSQGACLGLEYVARHAVRFGGVVAFSGGLIGSGDAPGEPPDDTVLPDDTLVPDENLPPDEKLFEYTGSLDGTPVFLGCGDTDPHIPVERVHLSAKVLAALGGAVTERIYPGHDHGINVDEIRMAQALLRDVAGEAQDGTSPAPT